MARAVLLVAVLLASSAAAAAASLPVHGTLVPGRSLAGVRLGSTAAQVRSLLGRDHGVCRRCFATTWYFTYRPFSQQGLAVELTRGRVSAVYTLWQPGGWRAPKGLQLGAPEAQVTARAGPLVPVTCSTYEALTAESAHARTVYYIVDGRLWGFGLVQKHASPCR